MTRLQLNRSWSMGLGVGTSFLPQQYNVQKGTIVSSMVRGAQLK